MDIRDIDKNFAQSTVFDKEKVDFFKVTEAPFELYGVFYDEKEGRFLRMSYDLSPKVSDGVHYLNRHTAGGRVRFSTNSKTLTLLIEYGGLEPMPHMTNAGCCGFSLCENTESEELFLGGAFPTSSDGETFAWQTTLLAGEREYTLHFPLYQGVKAVYIGLDKGAKVGKGKPYKDVKPILYYGSSITQGGCANRADNSYQGFISKRNNIDFINLGFSGNAKAEPLMIDYLAGLDCSVFVFDYDHNAPSAEFLESTHYAAYKRYRQVKPNVPVVFVSKPDGQRAEADTAKRLEIIRTTYEKAKAEGDENVYFINGQTFFGERWANSTVDGCHPTDFGFYQMSLVIERVLEDIFNKKNN